MVIDSSAIIAILLDEPEAEAFAAAIEADSTRLMSAASLVESSVVIEGRLDIEGGRKLDELIATTNVKIQPVTEEQAQLARQAYRTYGKGRHPASLNFGDCFSYALAKFLGERLLFKGNDFSQTDLPSAISS